jgi:hypothetical protein
VLVDIDSHPRPVNVSQQDQRLSRRGADELARADVHLQHPAIDWRPDQRALDLGLRLGDLSLGLIDLRLGDRLVRGPCARLEEFQVGLGPGHVRLGRFLGQPLLHQLLLRHHAVGGELLGPAPLIALHLQGRLDRADLRLGGGQLLGARHRFQSR